MKKIGKNTYEVKIGNTVKATTSSVAFLWKNWHYFYQLFPEKISANLVAEHTWSAKGFSTVGKFYLLYNDVRLNNGKFDYFSLIKYRFFKSFESKITLEYTRINSETLSYYLTTQVKLPSLLSPFVRLLHGTADAAAVYINVIGADGAVMITNNPNILKEKCGDAAYDLYMEFLNEETRILNGETKNFKHFTESELNLKEVSSDPLIYLFNDEIKYFETKNKDLYNDLKKSLSIYSIAPENGLANNRKIFEIIVKDILKKESVRLNSDGTLYSLCNQLEAHWEKTGKKEYYQNISTLMGTVRKFGNTSIHSNTSFYAESFKVSFQALLPICKWYQEIYNTKTT